MLALKVYVGVRKDEVNLHAPTLKKLIQKKLLDKIAYVVSYHWDPKGCTSCVIFRMIHKKVTILGASGDGS